MNFLKQLFYVLCFFLSTFNSFSSSYETKYIEKDSTFYKTELKAIKQYLNNGNTKDALEKLYIFIDEVERNNNTPYIIESKIVLADVLRENGDYKSSNEVFNEIIPLINLNFKKMQYVFFKKGGNFQLDNQVDSAKVNYEKAIFYAEKTEDNEDLRAKMHANLSGIYYLKQDYESAIEHSKIAANYQQIIGNKEIEAGILNNLGGIYYMQGKYNDALLVFEQAYNLVNNGQSILEKQAKSSSLINLAYAYSGLKDYKKAFEFQDKYFELNDSLQQELKYKEIAEIESKYQVATKEKEAAIEKSKRQKAELLTYGLGFAILILLLGVYGMYQLYKMNKKNHKLLISQAQLIHQNKLEKIRRETQSKILVATLDGRVEERKKISDILHGNVSALLSAANLHLHAGGMQFKGEIPEIEKAQTIISEASVQVRELSHTLISAILLKHGLGEAIKDFCEKSSNLSIVINCESDNIERFDGKFEIIIFNIINVLVDNILKHSQATKGFIKVEQLNGNLQMFVTDNGKGFDVNTENVEAGIGLSQVKARIEVLKGELKITSSKKGTQIYISVPIIF
jgi:signal transduction histidine kinase